jgi:hypothetical protein
LSEAIFCGAVVRLAHQLISGSSVLLDLTKLRLDQVEAGIFAFEFATQSLCQRMTFPGLECRKINLRPAQLRLDPTDPLGKQQTLDPIDMACAFADQTLTLPMRPACIFLLDRWHAHDSADVAFSAIDRDQGAQECQDVDPVGLDATSPTIDLDAGGIEDTAFDAELGQRSRQPEAIVPGLVADQDPSVFASSDPQSGDQLAEVAAGDTVNTRTIPVGKRDPKYPGLLA